MNYKSEYVWHKSSSHDDIEPITQVSGVCFDQSGKIIIAKINGLWDLPGGHLEENETPEMTLVREVREEVSVNITGQEVLGYFTVYIENAEPIYQVRYAALISEVMDGGVDPATGVVNERLMVTPEEFFNYVTYPEYRPMIVDAVEWFKLKAAQ